MEDNKKKILGKLERMCLRREYCREDIFRKALKLCEEDAGLANELLKSLIEDGFVDERRYASAFAREKAGIAGWGRVKIRYMLKGKHIDEEIIREALEEIDGDKAGDRLRKLLENKWKSLKEDKNAKLKLIKFALQRGYEYEQVAKLIEEICST